MKLVYVTDLHGSKWKYERIFEIAQAIKADVVINGGDMLPKDGDLFKQGKFINEYLDQYFSQFNSAGIYYLCYLGNDDLGIFDQLFEETCEKHSFVVSLAQRKFEIGNHEFIGMNWVVDYPFRLKDRCRKDTDDYQFQEQNGSGLLSTPEGWREINDWISYANRLPTIHQEMNGLVSPRNIMNAVYVIHMPPYKLGLDICYDGREVGSEAIHNFLEDNQPMLSLHGHIHESPEISGKWYGKLGRTICIQPGQSEKLTYVMIDLPELKFERIIETR